MNWDFLIMFLFLCAMAAFFVTWAKLEEEKLKTKEERERRWDEISRALSIEKERDYLESKCKFLENFNERCLEVEIENRMRVERERDDLQDRLSILLCPQSNHIWIGNRCSKCGRKKDV